MRARAMTCINLRRNRRQGQIWTILKLKNSSYGNRRTDGLQQGIDEMIRLNLGKTQRLLREQGADGSIAIRDLIGAARVGLMKLPIPSSIIPPVYYLTEPEDVHELLVKHGDKAEKVELVQRIARSTFGNGILMS